MKKMLKVYFAEIVNQATIKMAPFSAISRRSEREKNYLSKVIFFVIFVEPDSKVYKYNPLGKFSALKVTS